MKVFSVFYRTIYNTDFNLLDRTLTVTLIPTLRPTGPVTYIRGTSATIARTLQPYNVRVAHKPITI